MAKNPNAELSAAADLASPGEKFQALSGYYKACSNSDQPLSAAAIKSLKDSLEMCEGALKERFGTSGLFMDFGGDYKSVQLRVANREVNQSLRRLLDHVTTAQMAEEGDSNNYFSIFENTLEQGAKKVKELADDVAGVEGEWLEESKELEGFSRLNLVVAAHQLLASLNSGGKLPDKWKSQIIAINLEGFTRRLEDLRSFLSAVTTKELIEDALKADAVGIESESNGILAKISGRNAILFGSIVGMLFAFFAYPWLLSWLMELSRDSWLSLFLRLEAPPAHGLSGLALLAPVAVFLLLAFFGNWWRHLRVEGVRREFKNQIKFLLNHATNYEWRRTRRNLLDELTGKFDRNEPAGPSDPPKRSFTLKRSTEQEGSWCVKLGNRLQFLGLGEWLSGRCRTISHSIGIFFGFVGWMFLLGFSALLTVAFSLIPAAIDFRNVYQLTSNSAEIRNSLKVSLLMQTAGRELCLLARGNLYAENEHEYFVETIETRHKIVVAKSLVAKAIHGGETGKVDDCKTTDDTFKSVINLPAGNVQLGAPVNLHMIQLPATAAESANTVTTAMLPMATYFFVDGAKIEMPGPIGGMRSIFLPFFPNKVTKIVDKRDGKKERLAAYQFYYDASASGGGVRNAPGLKEYIAGVKLALESCLAKEQVMTIDIRGFASVSWKHGSMFNSDKLLNHYLAEGRRMAVAREFGFYKNSDAAQDSQHFTLVEGNQKPEAELPDGALPFRFKDFAEMRSALVGWYVPPDKSGVLEAMERSVVISYDESQLLSNCRG